MIAKPKNGAIVSILSHQSGRVFLTSSVLNVEHVITRREAVAGATDLTRSAYFTYTDKGLARAIASILHSRARVGWQTSRPYVYERASFDYLLRVLMATAPLLAHDSHSFATSVPNIAPIIATLPDVDNAYDLARWAIDLHDATTGMRRIVPKSVPDDRAIYEDEQERIDLARIAQQAYG